MKSTPIIFSSPMVRAILAGQKTQTRRLMKPQPEPIPSDDWRHKQHDATGYWWSCAAARQMVSMHDAPSACKYGTRGDRLWVKETWRAEERETDGVDGVRFAADDSFRSIENTREAADRWVDAYDNGRHGKHWRPSLYMPRWASRLTLEIAEVRVQRLQSISEEDAKAEGPLFALDEEQTVLFPELTAERNTGCYACQGDPHGIAELCHPLLRGNGRPFACWYATCWDSINGKRGPWAANPFVWAVTFKPVEATRAA